MCWCGQRWKEGEDWYPWDYLAPTVGLQVGGQILRGQQLLLARLGAPTLDTTAMKRTRAGRWERGLRITFSLPILVKSHNKKFSIAMTRKESLT